MSPVRWPGKASASSSGVNSILYPCGSIAMDDGAHVDEGGFKKWLDGTSD